jgi:protein gp37
MGNKTGISWTDSTWNPLRGCSRVSEGCRNCYAERVAGRFSGPGMPYEGLVTIGEKGPRWNGSVRLVPERLADPLRWKRPRRIFVNSMSDLFHENVSNEDIAAIFGIMAAAPQHTFQVLTKRPKRMREWFDWVNGKDIGAIAASAIGGAHTKLGGVVYGFGLTTIVSSGLPNVWLGVSVEDRNAAAQRIPLLLETPSVRRFVSFEPALEEVDFTHIDADRGGSKSMNQINALTGRHSDMGRPCADVAHLDWIIVGGESGSGARPFDLRWARSVVEQGRAAGVPVFVKQLGAKPIWTAPPLHGQQSPESIVSHGEYDPDPDEYRFRDRAGADMAEWPEDLRVQQFPGDIV